MIARSDVDGNLFGGASAACRHRSRRRTCGPRSSGASRRALGDRSYFRYDPDIALDGPMTISASADGLYVMNEIGAPQQREARRPSAPKPTPGVPRIALSGFLQHCNDVPYEESASRLLAPDAAGQSL